MKKSYIKAEIIDSYNLQLNEAIAGCSVAVDERYQIFSQRDQTDGYTRQEVNDYMVTVQTDWDPDDWNPRDTIICPCYLVTISFPPNTPGARPGQTSVSFFYEDWDIEHDLDDWRVNGAYSEESTDWAGSIAKGWQIATASQQDDFVNTLLGSNLGKDLSMVNS